MLLGPGCVPYVPLRPALTLHEHAQHVADADAAIVLAILVEHGHAEDLVVGQDLVDQAGADAEVSPAAGPLAEHRSPREK